MTCVSEKCKVRECIARMCGLCDYSVLGSVKYDLRMVSIRGRDQLFFWGGGDQSPPHVKFLARGDQSPPAPPPRPRVMVSKDWVFHLYLIGQKFVNFEKYLETGCFMCLEKCKVRKVGRERVICVFLVF